MQKDSQHPECQYSAVIEHIADALDPTPGNGGWVLKQFDSLSRDIQELRRFQSRVLGGVALMAAIGGAAWVGRVIFGI